MEEKNDEAAILSETEALKSFLCLLYVGKESSYYKAKPWNDDDYYLYGIRMRSLEILASNKKTELLPLDKIKLAMDSSLIQRPETVMFALAMCARQNKSEKLRAAAYYFVTEHCKEWRYFVLFIKYASYLCRNDGAFGVKQEKHIGWGRGWKNAVNNWYLRHDATDLAILIGRYKGGCGWKHKDILTLSHIDHQSLDEEKKAVIKYALMGHHMALHECHDDPGAMKQLDYLKQVDDFRRCKDPEVVAEKITKYGYTIDHVNPEALKFINVWHALLPGMDIRTVLKYIPKLTQLGFLTENSPITEIIVRTLVDDNNIRWNKVLPAEILEVFNLYAETLPIGLPVDVSIELMSFIQSMMKECAIKSKKKVTKKMKTNGIARPVKKSMEKKLPHVQILDALRNALSLSQKVDITESSKKSYCIAMRLPTMQGKDSCIQAGLSIALPLLNRYDTSEAATTIIGYEPRIGIGYRAKITKGMSHVEALEAMREMKKIAKTIEPITKEPFEWCSVGDMKFDVFVNVTNDPPSEKSNDPIREWKKFSKSENARYINIIINKRTFELKGDRWDDILTINGFDPHVPSIIEAYVRGLF